MKLRFLFLFVAALALAACSSNSSAEHGHDHDSETHTHEEGGEAHNHGTEAAAGNTHSQGKEYTAAYVCPMHCEGSGSEEPGTCPVCGMDYEARAEHIEDGHSHQ